MSGDVSVGEVNRSECCDQRPTNPLPRPTARLDHPDGAGALGGHNSLRSLAVFGLGKVDIYVSWSDRGHSAYLRKG